MNAGEFDEVLTLFTVVETKGPKGQLQKVETTMGTIYAKVLHSMDDQVAEENLNMKETITVECWKDSAINTRWSAEWNGDRYDIVSIDMGERLSPYMTMTLEKE